MGGSDKDTIDHLIAFLQKREGIDKTLKLIRYTSRLIAAVSPADSEAYKRFSAFEKSIGVSRKAFRLGKFLQDYNNLRKSQAIGVPALLELVAYGGEGIYFFIEQIVWMIKAGALDKSSEKQLATMSAWAEFIGYLANICLSCIKLRTIAQEMSAVRAKLQKEEGAVASSSSSRNGQSATSAVAEGAGKAAPAAPQAQQPERKLPALAAARQLRVLAITQDLADSVLALNDIRGGQDKLLSHPVTLALAGLLSGIISAHKNWNA